MGRTVWETIQVTGNQLADAVEKLIAAGNIRRIRIRQGDRTIAEFPLTIGVVGAVFAPMLAAVGALAALITECTIDIEREVEESSVQSPESRVQDPGSKVQDPTPRS
jgi:hypothetical protein